jgi:hypothetical protein
MRRSKELRRTVATLERYYITPRVKSRGTLLYDSGCTTFTRMTGRIRLDPRLPLGHELEAEWCEDDVWGF